MEKQKAIEKLQAQLNTIAALKRMSYGNRDFKKWRRDTKVLLANMFGGDNNSHVREFAAIRYSPRSASMLYDNTAGYHTSYLKGLETSEAVLESMITEIEEWGIGQDASSLTDIAASKSLCNSSEVFLVHGRDEAAKQAVARFIEKLDLTPVILHEQPNEGHTIIEKFEKYSNVGFAVVLITPDDVGALAEEKPNLKPRARQNVILELGFFLGKLGRHRVCALYKQDVEIPSDYKGVLFIPMDAGNGWQLSLAKEIKAAGIELDLNRVI